MAGANEDTTYNGWANWETWNVALWIGNDEGLYLLANSCKTYADFLDLTRELGRHDKDGIYHETPDGARWDSDTLDIPALDEMIAEL